MPDTARTDNPRIRLARGMEGRSTLPGRRLGRALAPSLRTGCQRNHSCDELGGDDDHHVIDRPDRAISWDEQASFGLSIPVVCRSSPPIAEEPDIRTLPYPNDAGIQPSIEAEGSPAAASALRPRASRTASSPHCKARPAGCSRTLRARQPHLDLDLSRWAAATALLRLRVEEESGNARSRHDLHRRYQLHQRRLTIAAIMRSGMPNGFPKAVATFEGLFSVGLQPPGNPVKRAMAKHIIALECCKMSRRGWGAECHSHARRPAN